MMRHSEVQVVEAGMVPVECNNNKRSKGSWIMQCFRPHVAECIDRDPCLRIEQQEPASGAKHEGNASERKVHAHLDLDKEQISTVSEHMITSVCEHTDNKSPNALLSHTSISVVHHTSRHTSSLPRSTASSTSTIPLNTWWVQHTRSSMTSQLGSFTTRHSGLRQTPPPSALANTIPYGCDLPPSLFDSCSQLSCAPLQYQHSMTTAPPGKQASSDMSCLLASSSDTHIGWQGNQNLASDDWWMTPNNMLPDCEPWKPTRTYNLGSRPAPAKMGCCEPKPIKFTCDMI